MPRRSWQVLCGDRRGRRLAVPKDGDDPVAVAVLEHLDGIDAALEWLAIFRVAGFVGGEDVHDVAEALGGVVDAALEEALFERRRGALLVLLRCIYGDVGAVSSLVMAGGDEPRIRNEEGAEALPVAWLPGRAGDDVVERGEDGVDGGDVSGIGFGPIGDAPLWRREGLASRSAQNLEQTRGQGRRKEGLLR